VLLPFLIGGEGDERGRGPGGEEKWTFSGVAVWEMYMLVCVSQRKAPTERRVSAKAVGECPSEEEEEANHYTWYLSPVTKSG